MSGYFGALLRSSGLGVAYPPPAFPLAEPGVTEVNVEHSARPARPVAALEVLRPPVPGEPIERRVANQVAAPRMVPRTNEAREEITVLVERPGERASASTPNAAEAGRLEPSMPLDQAMIRAAVRWVHAGVHEEQRDGVVHANPTAPSLSPRGEHPAMVPVESTPERSTEMHAMWPLVPNEVRLSDSWPRPMTVPSQIVSPPSSTAAPPNVSTPADTAVRDEVVEISIGAINVRIDGPPMQTITRPAAPSPAATGRAAPTPSQRSALSRRALRRI